MTARRARRRSVRGARVAARSVVATLATACGALAAGVPADAGAAGGLDLTLPPARHAPGTPAGAPWTDGRGADHVARDAERRSRERPVAAPGPSSPSPSSSPSSSSSSPAPSSLSPPPPGAPAAPEATPAADPAVLDELRRRGARERDAREGRGSTLPPPTGVPRIQPDPPPAVRVAPPPRIAIPAPGEPGGPPIALPSCGPAGCFDANGRPMPRFGGTDVLIGPGGRPCIQVGGAAGC